VERIADRRGARPSPRSPSRRKVPKIGTCDGAHTVASRSFPLFILAWRLLLQSDPTLPDFPFMGLIADDICQNVAEPGPSDADRIDWRQRYEGVLMVAYLDGKAVAGISGPWPVNQYALTWWDRPVPARQLELFDSFEAAQQRVEEWAFRMRTIGVADRPPANDPVLNDFAPSEATASIAPRRAQAAPQESWLGRLRGAMTPVPRKTLPRQPALNEDELRDVHFAAYE
jgi:hypothetical protein